MTNLGLEADCRLVSLIPDWSPAGYVEINSGVQIVRKTKWDQALSPTFSFSRDSGIYAPNNDWRPIEPSEWSLLSGLTDGQNLATSIQLFRIPDALYLRGLNQIEPHLDNADANGSSGGAITLPRETTFGFLSEVGDWITDNIFADISDLKMKSAIAVLRPGSDSSTGWRGLHIDIWGQPLDRQLAAEFSGLVLVANLGRAPRRLVYTNIRIATMLRRWPEMFESAEISPLLKDLRQGRLNQMFIANAFLEKRSDYPTISIRLDPGHAYLAPTTTIPHDGNLVGMTVPDISLRIAISGGSAPTAPWKYPSYRRSWTMGCLDHSRRDQYSFDFDASLHPKNSNFYG